MGNEDDCKRNRDLRQDTALLYEWFKPVNPLLLKNNLPSADSDFKVVDALDNYW